MKFDLLARCNLITKESKFGKLVKKTLSNLTALLLNFDESGLQFELLYTWVLDMKSQQVWNYLEVEKKGGNKDLNVFQNLFDFVFL